MGIKNDFQRKKKINVKKNNMKNPTLINNTTKIIK